MSNRIKYREGFKYVLAEDYILQTDIRPESNVACEYVSLYTTGLLTIYKGFPWDGASGPTFDTASSMRGSLVHDALYKLMRLGLLHLRWRVRADEYLFMLCKQDGMWFARARLWHRLVGRFGLRSATIEGAKPVLTAP